MSDRPDYVGRKKEQVYSGSSREFVFDGMLVDHSAYTPDCKSCEDNQKLVAQLDADANTIDLFAVRQVWKAGVGLRFLDY